MLEQTSAQNLTAPPVLKLYGTIYIVSRVEWITDSIICCTVHRVKEHPMVGSELTPDAFRIKVSQLLVGEEFPRSESHVGSEFLLCAKVGKEERFNKLVDVNEELYKSDIIEKSINLVILKSIDEKFRARIDATDKEGVANQSASVNPEPFPVTSRPLAGANLSDPPLVGNSVLAPERTPQPVLVLGGQYFVLQKAITHGRTAVVWKARRSPSPLDSKQYELLLPGDAVRQRLLTQTDPEKYTFPDYGSGEWVAVKIAGQQSKDAEALRKEAAALRRLGAGILRMHFPNPDQRLTEPLWPDEFPCIVIEWANGQKLSQLAEPLPELKGLLVIQKLCDLLHRARQLAPDIVPTDTVKADGVFIDQNANNEYVVQLIDWGVYESREDNFREMTLPRLGEVMTRIFAPTMKFEIDRGSNSVPFEKLGALEDPDPARVQKAAQEWDMLSYGTRALIRRVLERGFGGQADAVIEALRKALGQQLAFWQETEPLSRYKLRSGIERLNWLDIATAKSIALTEVQNKERKNLLREQIGDAIQARKQVAALVDLRTAVRLSPEDSYLRWALLALMLTTPQSLGAEAFQTHRLDEALGHLKAERYAAAEQTLLWARAAVIKSGDKQDVPDYLNALLSRARLMAEVTRALALTEVWRMEDADAALALVRHLNDQCRDWENKLFGDQPDQLCVERIDALEKHVGNLKVQRAPYDAAINNTQAENKEELRKWRFARLLDRAKALGEDGDEHDPNPGAWEAALRLWQDAAAMHPEMAANDYENERQAVAEKLANHYLKRAHESANYSQASDFLSRVLHHRPNQPEALTLQAGWAAYQYGLLDLEIGRFESAVQCFQRSKIAGVPVEDLDRRIEIVERLRDQAVLIRSLSQVASSELVQLLTQLNQAGSDVIQWNDSWPEDLRELVNKSNESLKESESKARILFNQRTRAGLAAFVDQRTPEARREAK